MSMKMMVIVAVSAATGFGAAALGAQSPQRDGLSRSNVAERALSLREHLELSDEQVASLNQFRQELLALRVAAMADLMRIRSDVAAGQLTRADAREQLASRREEMRVDRSAHQERLAGILSEDQLQRLRESQQRTRRGRARMPRFRGGRGGPGMRGPRGFRQGVG